MIFEKTKYKSYDKKKYIDGYLSYYLVGWKNFLDNIWS